MGYIKDNDEGTVYSLFPDDIDYITSDYFNKKGGCVFEKKREIEFKNLFLLYLRNMSGFSTVYYMFLQEYNKNSKLLSYFLYGMGLVHVRLYRDEDWNKCVMLVFKKPGANKGICIYSCYEKYHSIMNVSFSLAYKKCRFNKKDNTYIVFNKENPFSEDLSLWARESSGYDFVSEIAHKVLCHRK